MKALTLYGYWRSSASWRVRIALNLKSVAYTYVPVNLIAGGGQQHAATFTSLNPMAQVPVLDLGDGRALGQSLAIIRWIESLAPEPPLVPQDPYLAAQAWEMAELVNAGIQPLANLSVMNALKERGVDEIAWARTFVTKGLKALEAMVATRASQFALGDTLSIADVCVVPQLYVARRYGVDLTPMPTLLRIEAACNKLPAFAQAHPDVQPDAPGRS